MKRVFVAVLIGILGGAAGFVAIVEAGGGGREVELPAVSDPSVPQMPRDVGAGERLLLVVGGTYASRVQAQAAAAELQFGDLQGYYVVPTGQFRGLLARLPVAGRFALVSAFRTSAGARAFARLARAAGAPALITERVVSAGGAYAGLGQEAAPDGSGPLTHAIPASMPDPAEGS
jgi:hypothetical protein